MTHGTRERRWREVAARLATDRVMPPASHQPNVPGRGITAAYGPRFWALAAGIGVAAGLGGGVLMKLLELVEHVAWAYDHGGFVHAVEQVSGGRLVAVLLVAGALAGAGTYSLARLAGSGGGEISEALWLRGARLPLLSSLARGVLSIVIVAMGASLGREGAPQLAGAAVASRGADAIGLPDWQRRLLVACGAGAGMAAVYNVPLGGALFALEVLLGTVTLPLVLPALATSTIATACAWLLLGDRPTYLAPSYHVSLSQLVWAAIVGPLAGVAAVGWVHVIARANALRPHGRWRIAAPVIVFGALGLVALAYPRLLGNGLDIVQPAILGRLSIGLLVVLLVLKPLATAACLGSGAPGGLFTPTLAVGVLLGGVLGDAWIQLWPGAPLGSYALIGGAALLGAAMQGPLAAVALTLELTRHTDALMVPMLLGVALATITTRLLRAPSIYSARLASGQLSP